MLNTIETIQNCPKKQYYIEIITAAKYQIEHA